MLALPPIVTGALSVAAGVISVVPVTRVKGGSMMVMILPVVPPLLEFVGVFVTLD